MITYKFLYLKTIHSFLNWSGELFEDSSTRLVKILPKGSMSEDIFDFWYYNFKSQRSLQ